MTRAVAVQHNPVTQTQDVLYIHGETVTHIASYKAGQYDTMLNSILDWTQDGLFGYGDYAPKRVTLDGATHE